MYKKAGIVIGIVVVLLTIAIVIGVNHMSKEKVKTNKNVSNTNVANSSGNNSNKQVIIVSEKDIGGVSKDNISKDDLIKNTSETKSSRSNKTFIEIDEDSLGDYESQEEIVLVSKKKLVVLDNNSNKGYKQLSYCIDLILNDGTVLSYFVPLTSYESIIVGDKVKVIYNIYKNDNGTKFPTILSVSRVE